MATYSSKDIAFFLVNGRDMRAVSGELSLTPEAKVIQTDGFSASWEEYTPTGTYAREFSQNGFFDTATDSSHDAFSSANGESAVVCLGLEADAIGSEFVGMTEVQTKYVRVMTRGDLTRANAEYVSGGTLDEGSVLFADDITADTDTESTSVDGEADTESGGAVYLQVSELALDGYTDLTVVVQHSKDDATWSELATFAAVTDATAAQRIAVTGDVYRYLSVDISFTGTGGDPKATLMVGAARNPDPEE